MALGEVFSEVREHKAALNRAASEALGPGNLVFAPVSLPAPRFSIPELGFSQSVSWLYVLYQEAGTASVRYLETRHRVEGGENGVGVLRESRQAVSLLRRLLQHNMSEASRSDTKSSRDADAWFQKKLGVGRPVRTADWDTCSGALLTAAADYLRALRAAGEGVLSDPERGLLCNEWARLLARDHQPYAFDEMVEEVAEDWGRSGLKVKAFRERYIRQWKDRLEILADGYVFEEEARRLIERSLMAEDAPVLPVTGRQLVEEFGVDPGEGLAEVMQRLRRRVEDGPRGGAASESEIKRFVEEELVEGREDEGHGR